MEGHRAHRREHGAERVAHAGVAPVDERRADHDGGVLEVAGGEKMRGLGAMSDADAKRLSIAVGSLSTARNDAEFKAALAEALPSVKILVIAALTSAMGNVLGEGKPPAKLMMPGRSVTFKISRINEGFMRSARAAIVQFMMSVS